MKSTPRSRRSAAGTSRDISCTAMAPSGRTSGRWPRRTMHCAHPWYRDFPTSWPSCTGPWSTRWRSRWETCSFAGCTWRTKPQTTPRRSLPPWRAPWRRCSAGPPSSRSCSLRHTRTRCSACSPWRSRRHTLRRPGSLLGLHRQLMNREDLDDAELPRRRGKLEQRHVAHSPVHQRTSDGRRHGDVPIFEVHRVAEDQVVDLGGARLHVLHRDARAQSHLVRRNLRHVNLRQLAQALAQLPQPRLNELLPLQRGLVFAVLAQVSELHGAPDFGGERDIEFVLQAIGLRLQLLLELFDHGCTRRKK